MEREIATYILMDLFELEAYNNIMLRNTFKKYPELDTRDKGFITEIVNGTLRNLIHIDYVINSFSKVKTKKMKKYILNLMRISVYQIMYMDKVPDSAVCNEAVKLAKKKGFSGLSGFVNGVLRNIARKYKDIEYPKAKNEYISIIYSLPLWYVDYLLEYHTYEEVEKIGQALLQKPTVNLAINQTKITAEELEKILIEDGVEIVEKGDGYFQVKNINIEMSEAFANGYFHVMDANAIDAVHTLNPSEKDKVLDLCAAPGGKSFVSAYMGAKDITSCDIFEHKLNLIKDNASRLGLDLNVQLNDGLLLNEDFVGKFDKIIVDVPCSGFGLLKKKPDIKYFKHKEDIESLMHVQRKILSNASKYVKEDGQILYATCTISPLENKNNIEWFTNKFEYEVIEEKNLISGLNTDNDGFYICLLKRRA